MYKSILKDFQKGKIIVIAFLILSFLFDLIDKIEIFYGIDFIKFNKLLKFFFLTFCLFFSIYHIIMIYEKIRFILIVGIGLIMIFFIKYEFYQIFYLEFLRYIFIIIAFPFLYYVFFLKNENLNKLVYGAFKYIILINAITILVGIAFKINLFKTYDSQRFGYNGILLSQGLTPYFYLSATVFFWTLKDKLFLTLTVICALLSGVKGVYFAESMLFVLLILFDTKFNRGLKIKFVLGILLCFILVIIVLLSIEPFKSLISSGRYLSAIFSLRFDRFLYDYSNLSKENFNLMTGMRQDYYRRLELQIVDLIMFFGMIGIIIYTYFTAKIYCIIKKSKSAVTYLITAVFLSILMGNLFYIPLVSFLLIITAFSLVQINEQ